MSATAIDTNRTSYTVTVGEAGKLGSQPLSDAEAKQKISENHQSNLQEIQKALGENSAGYGSPITIRVPADSNGKPIMYPTEQDWIIAAKNGAFVETAGTAADLSRIYYNTNLVDLGDAALNAQVNAALLTEVLAAVKNGSIAIKKSDIIPTTEGNLARAIIARQISFNKVSRNIGTNFGGQMDIPPADKVTMKVPADASGKPIKNPTLQDWINAEKKDQYAEVTGSPFELSKDYLGVELDTSWKTANTENRNALRTASDKAMNESKKSLDFNKAVDAGNRMDTTVLSGLDSNIITDAMSLMGKNYNDSMNAANEESLRMDNLRKKYDALKALESSVSSTNTAGSNAVDFNVPTKRYELDVNGNRIPTGTTDANGKPTFKTQNVSSPPTNDDWANAAEFKSIKELNGGNNINGRKAATTYFGMTLSNTSGDNAHNINLSNNLTKISNERSLVDADMKKISGKFDFNMGNVQTNLSLVNKVMTQLNDTALSIARGI